MKKGKIRVLALALALLCVCGTAACSSKEGESSSSAGKTSSAGSAASSKQANAKPSGELTQESLKSYPVTPESQFETEDVSGGVSVTSCDSEDAVVVVPKTIKGKPVVEIGYGGMDNLSNCKGIALPDNVKTLGIGAFCNDPKLEYVDLGKGLKEVNGSAFNGCCELRTVTFPEGITTLYGKGELIFAGCGKLKEVYVPASVTKINDVFFHSQSPDAVIVTPAGSAADKWARNETALAKNNPQEHGVVPVKNQ